MDLEKLKQMKEISQPYTTSLKIKVAKIKDDWTTYTRSNGKASKYMKFMAADERESCKAIAYDVESQRSVIKEGNCLLLRNFSYQQNTLKLTSKTKIYRCEPLNTIEVKLVEENKVPIGELQNSPSKAIVSVQGLVTKDEAVKDVTFKGRDAKVKEITLEDHTGAVKVALWDRQSSIDTKCGKTLHISDAVVKFSQFHNANTLSVNNMTSVEDVEIVSEITGSILAISADSADTFSAIFKCEDGEREYKCKKDVFETYFKIDEATIDVLQERYIKPFLPINCKISATSGNINKIE